MSAPLTSHVLDTALGVPAEGVRVTLTRERDGAWETVAVRTTNRDGRVADLLAEGELRPGRWALRFEVAPYYAARQLPCFFPWADVVFDVTELTRHHHVPLLISPFAYSTYRGS